MFNAVCSRPYIGNGLPQKVDLNGAESCGTALYDPARSCRKRIGGRNNCVQFGHKKISRPTGG